MATTVRADFKAEISWSREDSETFGGTTKKVTDNSKLTYAGANEAGTANNQIDRKYAKQHTIAGSGTLSLDLTAIAETIFGDAASIGMVEIASVMLVNENTVAADDVTVGGDAAAWVGPFGNANDTIELAAGSCLFFNNRLSGWPVVATTGDILKFTNQSLNAVTIDVVITGRSV
jgi:hypothetical protein